MVGDANDDTLFHCWRSLGIFPCGGLGWGWAVCKRCSVFARGPAQSNLDVIQPLTTNRVCLSSKHTTLRHQLVCLNAGASAP
eukprot:2986982-Amphidinium_carterae.1